MLVKKWIINKKSDHVELCGLYLGKRNFWVHATLANHSVWMDNPQNGVIWDNPRNVSMPNYVKREVYKMLFHGAKYPRITKLYRDCAMSLWLDLEQSEKNGRATYSYSVQTPEFEVWRFNEETKEYDIEQYDPVIFEGSDFAPAPSTLENADTILDDLLEWLTLSPGDTDREYFESYAPDQIAWTQSAECMDIKIALYAGDDK